MKKNVLFFGCNDDIFKNFLVFFKNKKFIFVSSDIKELEEVKLNFDLSVYPLIYNENDFFNFGLFLKKKFIKFDEFIVNLDYVTDSMPIENIDINKWIISLNNFNILLFIFKYFLKNFFSKNLFMTFIIKKKYFDKNIFLYQHECFNNLLITLMKELNKEYINKYNIITNCISLEHCNFFYKKYIYPLKFYKTKNSNIALAYKKIVYNRIKNKVIVF